MTLNVYSMTTLRRIDVKAKRKDNRIMTVKKLRLDFAEQFCIRIEEKQCLRHTVVKNKMTVPESANRSCIGGQKRDQFNTAMQQLFYSDEQKQFKF